jgi:hypothetical protein
MIILINTQGTRRNLAKNKGMEGCNFTMVAITKDNGKMIKCKDTGKCIILKAKLPIKDSGKMDALMAQARFLTILPIPFRAPLIIEILLKFRIVGKVTKAKSRTTLNMEREGLILLMESIL